MSTVKTSDVRNRIIGDARKTLKKAAGSNEIISKTEQKKLPRDLAATVDKAREESARVTVGAAVDAYASHVSHVLTAVDKRSKGNLSESEANKILDPSLRRKVLDVRAELLRGGDPSSGATEVFDTMKSLMEGKFFSSGGGVEAAFKPFISEETTTRTLTAEFVRELLTPAWGELKTGVWADGSDLDNFTPELGNPEDLEVSKRSRSETDEFFQYYTSELDYGLEPLCRYMKQELKGLTIVNFLVKNADGVGDDMGHSAFFVGGKTADGHVVGFLTGQFIE